MAKRRCHVIKVNRAGYYAWRKEPVTAKQQEDRRITGLIKQFWLYLAVVLDLFSRQVIGWLMQQRIDRELALNALLMAVWRRQPEGEVIVHSGQGSQFSSYDWRDFLKAHSLVSSMSRRGNRHDNAVAESFFQLLKREQIKRRI